MYFGYEKNTTGQEAIHFVHSLGCGSMPNAYMFFSMLRILGAIVFN